MGVARYVKKVINVLPDVRSFSSTLDHFPNEVHLSMTNRCNLICTFCGQDKIKWGKLDELTVEDYKEIIDQVALMKDTALSFGGGEIYVYHGFDEVLDYCIQKQVPVDMILTNGTLLDERRITALLEANPGFIGFSIDGLPDTHNLIRGQDGTYDKTVASIKAMTAMKKKRGLSRPLIGINMVITRQSMGDMEAVSKIAAELSVDRMRYSYLNYISEKKLLEHKQYLERMYPDSDFCYWEGFLDRDTSLDSEKLAQIVTRMKSNNDRPKIQFSFDLNEREIDKWYNSDDKVVNRCGFFDGFFILPNGDYPLCDYIRYTVGNVKERSMHELWNDTRARSFRKAVYKKLLPGCDRCCGALK